MPNSQTNNLDSDLVDLDLLEANIFFVMTSHKLESGWEEIMAERVVSGMKEQFDRDVECDVTTEGRFAVLKVTQGDDVGEMLLRIPDGLI